jgi:hypothetical protein
MLRAGLASLEASDGRQPPPSSTKRRPNVAQVIREGLPETAVVIPHFCRNWCRRSEPRCVLTAREQEVLAPMAGGDRMPLSISGFGSLKERLEPRVRGILTKFDLTETGDDHRRVSAVITFLEALLVAATRNGVVLARRRGHSQAVGTALA